MLIAENTMSLHNVKTLGTEDRYNKFAMLRFFMVHLLKTTFENEQFAMHVS
jgi:hypothetical protein